MPWTLGRIVRLCVSVFAGLAVAAGVGRAAPVCPAGFSCTRCGKDAFASPPGAPKGRPPPQPRARPPPQPKARPPPLPQPNTTPAAVETNVGLKPSQFRAEGRTHYYQIPANPRGTLIVLPGCARWGPGFWPYDKAACPQCVGLTEDVAHTKQALARGYAVLVAWPVDAAHPGQYCWNSGDFPSVVRVLEAFVTRFGLASKPIVAMGASSGGTVMLRLPAQMAALGSKLRLSGILAEVSTNLDVADVIPAMKWFPPIAWVTMSNPAEIAAAKARVKTYSRHAPAATIVSVVKPVTPAYFSDRHTGLAPAQSAQLVAAMKRIKLLRADGTFAYDFKKNKAWVPALQRELPWLKAGGPAYALAPTKASAILQAMLVAQSGHEHVCDYLTAALMWFEGGGKGSFADLARRYQVVRPAALTMARQAAGAEPTPARAFAYGATVAAVPATVPTTVPTAVFAAVPAAVPAAVDLSSLSVVYASASAESTDNDVFNDYNDVFNETAAVPSDVPLV